MSPAESDGGFWMSFWDSIRETALGVGEDIWSDSKDDIKKAASDEIKKRLGIQSPTEPATPAVIIQEVATNPLTYLILGGVVLVGVLLFRGK
ncbi:MAG: hypothetical protein KF802_01210 [Bdellovibrionaceae bacterium]|nr:hypothetical protein [Pseudobdellovibrionaceae bacterium]